MALTGQNSQDFFSRFISGFVCFSKLIIRHRFTRKPVGMVIVWPEHLGMNKEAQSPGTGRSSVLPVVKDKIPGNGSSFFSEVKEKKNTPTLKHPSTYHEDDREKF